MSDYPAEIPPEQMDRITEIRRLWAIAQGRRAAREARERAEAAAKERTA